MAPNTSKPTMKQSKLSFGASKPTAVAAKSTKGTPVTQSTGASSSSTPATRRSSKKQAEKEAIDSSDEEDHNLDDIDDSKLEPDADLRRTKKKQEESEADFKSAEEARTKAISEVQKPTRTKKEEEVVSEPKVLGVPVDEKAAEKAKELERKKFIESRPHLNVKDKAYNQISSETKTKMGHAHTIHGKDLNRIDDILRVFDMSYEYGPCVGLTRLERWERANAMGLNPPQEVHSILMTQEGLTDTRYSQNVLAGRV